MNRPELDPDMKDKSRLLLLAGVMALVAVSVGVISILTLYRVTMDAERARLVGVVQAQAGILEAIARFDREFSADDHPDGARAATMVQVLDAFGNYENFGESGELVLAERDGTAISFLANGRRSGDDTDYKIAWSSALAAPMHLALSGQSGTVVALDYAGISVLAAYAPVAGLNLGLVAKIDVTEMRRPFVEATILSAFGGAFILLMGAMLFNQISAPMLRREEAEAQYRLLLESTAEAIYGIDLDGDCTFVNPACVQMLGYANQSALLGRNMHELMHHTRPDGSDYPASECRIYQAYREGKGTHIDNEVLWRADGSAFPAEYWSHPIERGGQIIGAVVTFLDITAHRQAEDVARREEARLSGILELAVEAVVTVGEDQRIEIFNAGAEVIFGYAAEEVIGKPLEMLLPVRNRAAHSNHLTGFEDSGPPRRMAPARAEIMGLRKDGSEFPAEASVSCIEVGGEKLLTATLRDLTERKASDMALLREKAQAEVYLNIAGSLIMALDTEGRITLMNRAARWALECGDEDVIGKLWLKTFAPRDEYNQRYQWYLEWLAGDGRDVEARTVTVVTRTGRHLLTRWHNRAIRDHAGKAIGTLCSGEDITESTRAAAALRDSEAHYRSIIDTTAEGFWRVDRDMNIVEVNDAICEMLGYEREEILGRKPFEFAEEALRIAMEEQIKAGIAGTVEPRNQKFRFRRRDGSRLEVRFSATSILDAEGNTSGRFAFFTDITEENKRAAQLRQAQKMEAVGQLTSGIAHDFNNMLTVVMGNLEMATEATGKGSDYGKYLSAAMQGAQKGADLNRQLLTFSRQQILEERRTDINEIVRGMSPLLERTLGKHIEIDIRFSEEDGFAMLDPAQLESAILNLAINARDAMAEGGTLKIATTISHPEGLDGGAGAAGKMIRISVKDDGAGMTAAVKEHALEPFFTTKEAGQGSGLGLSMVYAFTERYGGETRISSEPGQGTRVDIMLPVLAAEEGTASEPATVRSIARVNGNQTILVVEDQMDVRESVVANLEILGYRVLVAASGKEALDLVEAHENIDLMLCDMVMPGTNGEETVAAARVLNPRLRCLFMSGFPEKGSAERPPASTDIAILRKPFTRTVLAHNIQEVLGQEVPGIDP